MIQIFPWRTVTKLVSTENCLIKRFILIDPNFAYIKYFSIYFLS